MKSAFLLLTFILVLANVGYAAVIQGTIYDSSLNKVNNVVVEINTKPLQKIVAENSHYKLNVPKGNYTIFARNIENNEIVKENIVIVDDGEYNIDLFLFPNLDEEDISNETGLPVEDIKFYESYYAKDNTKLYLIGVGVLILFLILYLKYKPNKEIKVPVEKPTFEEEKEDLQKVIEVIKNSDGRITQKDLRKHIPLSEAKISLMIAELEAKGKIQKIKKGRGNILILK